MVFEPGKSGNPNGRPAGSRNAATLALDSLIDGEANAITQKCIDLAKAGDATCLRLCMDRLVPPRKERAVTFEIPKLEKAADCIPVMGAIMKAVGEGDLVPSEAAAMGKILESYMKATELTELAERISKLEKQNGER